MKKGVLVAMITVIIPVYDTQAYLRRCLDSVLAQTYPKVELLLIDDGSPDQSGAILEEYAKTYPNVQCFHTPHQGVSKARNLGLAHAKGAYVLFLDADDWLEPTALATLHRAVEQEGADVAACNFYEVYDDGRRVVYLPPMPKHLPHSTFVADTLSMVDGLSPCVFNKLFSARLLRESGLWFAERSDIYAEDAYFYYQIIRDIRRVAVVDQPLYCYYHRPSSATNSYKTNFLNRIIAFITGIDGYYQGAMTVPLARRMVFLFVELGINEALPQGTYATFKQGMKDPRLRAWLRKAKGSSLTGFPKLAHWLYTCKQYRALYALFQYKNKKAGRM